MKAPEEIKKGLACRAKWHSVCKHRCDKCDSFVAAYHTDDVCTDALAYIQQLERERDAAMAQLKAVDVNSYFECAHCKHEELCNSPVWPCNDCDNEECLCHTCSDGSNWQWRGVEEVE